MKVSILTETASWGGGEVHTAGLAQVLARRGHDVSVVALGHDVYAPLRGRPDVGFAVQKLVLPRETKRIGIGQWRTLLAPCAGKVGVLARWALGVGSLRMDLAARMAFDRYLVIEHSSGELPPRTSRRHLGGLMPGLGLWWYKASALWYLRSMLADLVVCVSEATRRKMLQQYRVRADKLLTIHNGIDVERFGWSAAHRRERRHKWGIAEGALAFGAVSRLSPEKGLDLAVEAFARLRQRQPGLDAHLVLVGEGAERERLEEQARAAGVADHVHLPGFSATPWEEYSGIDVFLMPSRDEALGLSLMEAMACGCCPIAAAVGGVPEVLCGPELGWLVRPGDVEALAEAMGRAAGTTATERAAMSRKARAHIEEHFDARRQYALLADVIEAQSRAAA